MDVPKTALEAVELPFTGMDGCGDNSCVIEKPPAGSMGTNGGCRCLRDRAKASIIVQRLSAVRDLLRREAEEVE